MKPSGIIVSEFDNQCYRLLRANISRFLQASAEAYDHEGLLLLDIAPQIHEGAKAYFKKASIETLDLDPASKATYIADITKTNASIQSGRYDIIVCTEVLEHTLNPFSAVDEIYRLLKTSGILLVTVPFNFRIHGPLPDCWRFTEHGLRELFKKMSSTRIQPLETPGRALMPIHYAVLAIK